MKICVGRYYRREQLNLECEIITPMFLGNACQEAELRAAPFKGLLRYWWRVIHAHNIDPGELYKEESALFGSPDDSGGKSLLSISVDGDLKCYLQGQFPKGETIYHREVQQEVDCFLYLGYGPILRAGKLKKEGCGAFRPGQSFQLKITYPSTKEKEILDLLACIHHFGAIGSRSRNGWGSFSIANREKLPGLQAVFKKHARQWEECFDLDYPNGLGKDNNRLLFWRSKNLFDTWEEAMNNLAGKYLELRLNLKFNGGGQKPHSAPQSRHILGYPTGTKHKVEGWGNCRHGSALRLIVRKENGRYRYHILYLPHCFSERMWPDQKKDQIKIWKKVHAQLCSNKLMQQITMEKEI
jgi:CRISPR-associated protein Cmr1